MDDQGDRRRAPLAVLAAGALGILIAIGAALGGALHFTGPRWVPGQVAKKPPIATKPPVNIPTATPKPSTTFGHLPNLHVLAIVIGSIAVAVVVFFVVRWLLRLRREHAKAAAGDLQAVPLPDELADEPSLETSMPYLRRGLQRALDALDSSRRPTDAIIEAWLGLQEAAEDAGFQRQSAETPTEFTTRILRQVDVDPRALADLRRLYLGVRFGDHVATADDVTTARGALLTLEAQWAATT